MRTEPEAKVQTLHIKMYICMIWKSCAEIPMINCDEGDLPINVN